MRFTYLIAVAAYAMASVALTPGDAETLAQLAQHTHYHGIAFARSGTAMLLLASHHGIFAVARDGTATRVSPVQDFMGFSPDPALATSYYASGHPATGGNSGFLQSIDGGATWKQLSEGAHGPVDFHQMDVSAADPKTIYGVFRQLQLSRDAGATWAAVGSPPPKLVAIAASAVSPEILYAATEDGLLLSHDGGRGWKPLAFTGEVVSTVQTGPDKALYAFVLGRGFMMANEDKPDSWTLLSNSFGEAVPLHVAADEKNGKHLALTTHNNDVQESLDGGKTWRSFGQASN